MKRSDSYVVTLDTQSVSDMQMLETIRKVISIANQYSKTKRRVCVRGRKPFAKLAKQIYKRGRFDRVSIVSYDRGGNIVGGLSNASKLDVYIYARR